MKQNKPVDPTKETSKDDSSDIRKVKERNASAPPQPKASVNKGNSPAREVEEAEKGHA